MATDPGWLWLIAGVALASAELLVPGVFLIWIGGGAFAAGLAALLGSVPIAGQFGVFTGVAVASVYAARHFVERSPIISDDPLLNERTARLIGQTVVVVDPIEGGIGRVRVGDGVWTATGPDAVAGARVEIVGATGQRLVVEPIAARRLSG